MSKFLHALALFLSVFLSPYLIPIFFIFIAIWHFEDRRPAWFIIPGIFLGIMPFIIALVLRKAGKISDLHISNLRQRRLFYQLTTLAILICIVVIYFYQAPMIIICMMVGCILGLLVLAITAPYLKLSGHLAVLSGALLGLWYLYGNKIAFSFILIPLLAWARLYRKRHTLIEIMLAIILGMVCMGIVLYFFLTKL